MTHQADRSKIKSGMLSRAAAVVCSATLVTGGFVTTVSDPNGTWWFEHDGERFLSFAVNHVNDGGQGKHSVPRLFHWNRPLKKPDRCVCR